MEADAPAPQEAPARERPRARRGRRWLALLLGLVLVAAAAAAVVARARLRGSLPLLEGEHRLPGLAGPVAVERDALGVPTIRGRDRGDVARALGFLHAQERFFQMDLLRRSAAGELAEIVGAGALEMDRSVRVHRFRARAEEIVRQRPSALLEGYVAGVNAGLEALDVVPFEYLVLGVEPAAWRPEDSVLCVFAMYLELQSSTPARESMRGLEEDLLPAELVAFLAPPGTRWDAPLLGGPPLEAPFPGPELVDLRAASPDEAELRLPDPLDPARDEPLLAGSNNWAVAGSRTAHGGALLANDMHLGLTVPGTWYRASLAYGAEGSERRVTGVTLPGTPAVTVGSNGKIAWGFTNSQIDVADLIIIEPDGTGGAERYLTPDGPRPFTRVTESIKVKGEELVAFEVKETIWGPVFDVDYQGRERALAWVAHDPRAVNMELAGMEEADSVEEAIEVAHRAGIPAQNLVVADAGGHIGWTIIGPVPRRAGHDGRAPRSWTPGDARWEGLLSPSEVPAIVDPPSGRIWTANARVVEGEMLERLGDGGYMLGARAHQIRDGLMSLERATEEDMLAIQLDDRALLLSDWRDALLSALEGDTDENRAEARRLVQSWSGRAGTGDVGYRIVRETRRIFGNRVVGSLTAPLEGVDDRYNLWRNFQVESALLRLAREAPAHLVEAPHADARAQLLAALDAVLADLAKSGPLAERTWGEQNTASIRHPLSPFIPLAWRLLDMPRDPLPGDQNMPRFQSPSSGASERMVVSPGREAEGVFHMPCGQSGHPLSPHYGDGHRAWVEGEATPFLPGKTVHVLRLLP